MPGTASTLFTPPRCECADVVQQLRRILNLVKDDRRMQPFDKRTGITAHAPLNIRIFKEDILGFAKQMTQKGRFPCSTRPCHDHRRKMTRGSHKNSGQFPRDVTHMRILN